jgi:hypothetical protein
MSEVQRELRLFSWQKDTRLLTAFISDLNLPKMPQFIVIFNPNTNQSRTFVYFKSERSSEDEIQAWHYVNVESNLKLTIWND